MRKSFEADCDEEQGKQNMMVVIVLHFQRYGHYMGIWWSVSVFHT
jgi:hypothetical protein